MNVPMAKFDLPFVTSFRDRHGRERYRFRRKGHKTVYLPGTPLSPAFIEAYRAAVAASPIKREPSRRREPGSFAALVADYLASPEYAEKAETTQIEYSRVLAKLEVEHGHKPVIMLERKHIMRWHSDMRDRPGAANTQLSTLKLLMSFAVDREYIDSNPATGIKKYTAGEWRPWTEGEIETFKARWASGTMQRRAFCLALYTGQRKRDLLAMTQGHRRDGTISVRQSKTGETLIIPEHPELTKELENVKHMSLLTTTEGKAFEPVYFGSWFAEAIDAAGLPVECVLHGLRKSAGQMLADAGCTDSEIMSITGHTTRAMVTKYTKSADQRRRAQAAIKKLSNQKENE